MLEFAFFFSSLKKLSKNVAYCTAFLLNNLIKKKKRDRSGKTRMCLVKANLIRLSWVSHSQETIWNVNWRLNVEIYIEKTAILVFQNLTNGVHITPVHLQVWKFPPEKLCGWLNRFDIWNFKAKCFPSQPRLLNSSKPETLLSKLRS